MHRLLLLILIAVASCSSVRLNSGPDLAEAVIRHELATSGSYMASNRAKTYFVLVEGRDISNDVIHRMADIGLPLRPASSWTLGQECTCRSTPLRLEATVTTTLLIRIIAATDAPRG